MNVREWHDDEADIEVSSGPRGRREGVLIDADEARELVFDLMDVIARVEHDEDPDEMREAERMAFRFHNLFDGANASFTEAEQSYRVCIDTRYTDESDE